MVTLEDRLRTFDDRWCVEFLRPIEMAKAGFIYLGIEDRVKCLSCSKDLEHWKPGDDPLAEHIFHSPHCPFLREPINDLQITTFEDRLKTFDIRWCVEFLRPFQMAQAGFIYLGIEDRVKCLSCSKELENWQLGDDPLAEHIFHSPQCPFIREPINGYDVCGPYGCGSTDIQSYIEAKKILNCLSSAGIIQQLKPLKYADFAVFDVRLKSFDRCMKTLKQDIHTLCKAGFFYTGNGTNDQLTCFYCEKVLNNWEDNDEPWTEHAKWSETCSYLLLNKGKIFIDKVRGVAIDITKSNLMELFNLIANHKDDYIFGTRMKIKPTKKIHDLLQNTDLSGEIIKSSNESQHLSQIQDPNTIPEDSMLCNICYKKEIEVAFIPCGHVVACIQCSLTIELCVVCRHPFNKAMRVYLSKDKDSKPVQHSSSKCSDNILDPSLCKNCQKEEIVAAFLPCRHVYACVKCAENMHECPVCTQSVFSFIELYI